MWYLTYYEEYPIYEPAEGGYYYAGVSEVCRYEFKTLNAALDAVPELADELMLHDESFLLRSNNETWDDFAKDFWRALTNAGRKTVATYRDRYIGEDRYLVLETPSKVGGLECGWHPYE